jgi:hypothetical protein
MEVLHSRPNISEELVKRSQLLSVRLMGLKESDVSRFFSKIREEYQKLPHEKKRWLPMLYVGVRH